MTNRIIIKTIENWNNWFYRLFDLFCFSEFIINKTMIINFIFNIIPIVILIVLSLLSKSLFKFWLSSICSIFRMVVFNFRLLPLFVTSQVNTINLRMIILARTSSDIILIIAIIEIIMMIIMKIMICIILFDALLLEREKEIEYDRGAFVSHYNGIIQPFHFLPGFFIAFRREG